MRIASVVAIAAVWSLGSCGQQSPSEPPKAKPGVTLSHERLPLGSPLEITYRFDVDSQAPPVGEDLRVFVHFVDADEELMWTDDHDPPIPTTQWKPRQRTEYTRTVWVPIYPYIGSAAIHMGLHSTRTQRRVTLSGEHVGQQAYRVAKLELLPQSENVFLVFKDGWNGPETAPNNPQVEWQWTKKREATLAFRNPKKDCLFYLELDNPSSAFPDGQAVQIKVGDEVVSQFQVEAGRLPVLHKIPVTATQLGTGEMVELRILTDKTFVPALLPGSTNKDSRELGIRVFHAFIQPNR
jgi:hypothetical protein